MQLVDSNIVFSLLVGSSPWHQAARELIELDDDWRTEAHALVEVSNILSRYVRARELSAAQAVAVMTEADERLRPLALRVGHVDALRLAIKHKVTAYDARFLLCAELLGVRLITEDAKLRNAAPGLTISLHDALTAAQG
jgi:predicted nucleic acid-binding protein